MCAMLLWERLQSRCSGFDLLFCSAERFVLLLTPSQAPLQAGEGQSRSRTAPCTGLLCGGGMGVDSTAGGADVQKIAPKHAIMSG